jgi:lipopolysaccharide transport system permease protein
MFVTPVIFPVAAVPEKIRWIVQLNPLTSLFELFRFSLLNEGTVTIEGVLYSMLITIVLLFCAMLLFNKQGDKLIDVL